MSNNFKEVIKSIPASLIKNIEVITNPPSKYEAEGVGGIINIITVSNTLDGYHGSINSGFDSHGSFNGSTYLNAKINKFTLSGRYFGSENKQPSSYGNSTRQNFNSDQYALSNNERRSKSKGNSNGFSGEASYEIDTFNLVSMSFGGYMGNNQSYGASRSQTFDTENLLTRSFESLYSGKSSNKSISGSVDYQKTFLKPDKTFTVSYKIDANPNSSNSNSRVDSCINYTPYIQKTLSSNMGKEQAFQADYFDPLNKTHQYECGINAIIRNNSNDSKNFRNDTLRTDYSNDLSYDQYIFGAYADYIFKLEKFTAKSGLRLERTWNYGVSASDSVVKFTNRLFNVIPYITFSYKIKDGKILKASYTQRLQRPGASNLNPYVNRSNPLSIHYGNPNLVCVVSHAFELGYSSFTQKINLNTSLSGSLNNNSIESVSSMDSSGVTTSTYRNTGINHRFNWNTYFSYRLGTKFNFYSNTAVSYVKFVSNNGYNLSNEGFGFYGSLGLRQSLWKNGAFSANGGYSTPSIYLQGKSSGYYYTAFGLSQYLLNRKMYINFSVSEPFRERRESTSDTKGNGYISHSESFNYVQNFRFSISYNFGKMGYSVKKAKHGLT
jgi:hypothetical protein